MPSYSDDVEYEDLASYEERRGRKRRRRTGGGCLLGMFAPLFGPARLILLVAVVVLTAMLTLQFSDFLRDPFDSVLSVFGFETDSEPEVVDNRTIVLGIREMAVLQTATGDIQVDKTVVDTGAAPDAELRVSYVGVVTAGIDLSLVAEEDIIANADGSVTVILPPAQLTGCYLGKPDVVSRSCTDIPGLQDCGKIVNGMQDEAYDRSIDELRETALEMNLLQLAYEEAEARLAILLDSLGYERVRFERSPEPLPASETCFSE